MQLISLLARFRRPLALFALTLAALNVTATALRAQTATDLTAAALAGKTVTCTIAGGNAPFETSGTFALQLGTPAAGQYTIAASSGNTTARTGTYTTTAGNNFINLRLNGYVLNNSTVEIELYPVGGITPGATYFEMFAGPANKRGTFTLSGGGATGVPVVTSATTATATVGVQFTYQITASGTPTPTTYAQFGGNTGVALNPSTGLVTHTFTTAGTFTFGVTANNGIGNSAIVIVTVTVGTGGTTAPVITSAATGSANVGAAFSYQITATNSPTSYSASGLPVGFGVNTATGLIFGTPGATAAGTYQINITATNAIGSTTGRLTLTVGTAPVVTFATAPANLVGYRNKVGQTFQFNITGSTGGIVWGTDVYTDDSTVARAAVHAGVVAVGETKTVTITILGGQSSYAASARNGITTSSWPAWPGSYAFSGATGGTATAVPRVASGFVAGTGTLAAGGRFICPITVTGGGTYTYRWYLNGVLIAGATLNPYVVESLTAANAGTYSVDVTNAFGTARLTAGSLTVGLAGSPVLALQPISKIVVPGATVSFATSATGAGLAYQWFRNNVALAGETGAILLRNNVNAADAGTYTVRVSNGSGSVTSAGGVLTLSPNASRPANISVRTNVATGALVTPGFVLQGSGSKRVLIRAVGPGLAQFGLTGVMADPKFTVFQGQTQIATNDDWTAANIGQAFVATGAFPITAGSKDAALVTDLAAGRDYTVQVTNATGTGGIVIIEVYDADALTGTSTSKLVNVSVRGQTAPGDDVLTLGLVIGGTGQRTLLVRGIGPGLAAFGVPGTVPDPRLQIFDSQSRAILANDDWANADFVGELGVATTYVGAFALTAGSRDAATLSLVDPGAYTIQVSGTTASPTGEALVEVYEVP